MLYPTRLLHTMLRVGDLERSLQFYVERLGMRLLRRQEYFDARFTLAFVGYHDERNSAVLELTHNWDQHRYDHGSGYGHIALAVADLKHTCSRLAAAGVTLVRPPGPMSSIASNGAVPETIAFIEDPDGYRIELIESAESGIDSADIR